MNKIFTNDIERLKIFDIIKLICREESSFVIMALIYSVFIGVVSLALPISVQLIINSFVFTATIKPIITIGFILFFLLIFSTILNLAQLYTIEVLQRKLLIRIACEICFIIIKSEPSKFNQISKNEFINRFFEIPNIQKILAKFLTKTITIILQTIAGIILVSFYHPLFLFFNISLIMSLYLIWKIFYKKALIASIYESIFKYKIAALLEDVASNHHLFKSKIGNDRAFDKLDKINIQYLKYRKTHFRSLFSQSALFHILYSLASSILLVFGGKLIIENQLSLGQLVAAEIVLSVIFYNISKFGNELESFYDLATSCEKLSHFYNIPLEENYHKFINDKRSLDDNYGSNNIEFKSLEIINNHQNNISETLKISKNEIIIKAGYSWEEIDNLIEVIYRFKNNKNYKIIINNSDLEDFDIKIWRNKLAVIDNSQFLSSKIIDYLNFYYNDEPNLNNRKVTEALNVTNLQNKINKINNGIEGFINNDGSPFYEDEKVLLKIAQIILQKPDFIIITPIFDIVSPILRKKIISYLINNCNCGIIYFTTNEREL